MDTRFLETISDPTAIVTALGDAPTFPESLERAYLKYCAAVDLFIQMALTASHSAQLLERIREPGIQRDTRTSLLKLFRRCVSPNLDTETTKKINKVPTSSLVAAYGHTFKSIAILKSQMMALDDNRKATLALLISEYDTRGQLVMN